MATLGASQVPPSRFVRVSRRAGHRAAHRQSGGGFVRVRAAAAAEPDLSVKVNGLQMPNPFVIGSGPPGTNYTVMKRAFDEGWGAVIAKTVTNFFFFCNLFYV